MPSIRGIGRSSLVLLGASLASCTNDTTSPGTLNFQNNPCTGGTSVAPTINQSVRIDCSNGGTSVTLAGGGASYLIVPEFATNQAPLSLVSYHVASGNLAAAGSAPALMARASLGAGAAMLPGTRNLTAQHAADRMFRAKANAAARAGRFRETTQRARSAPTVPATPPAVGSLRQFQVLSSFSVNAWKAVDAKLLYAGSNVLLYVDTLAPAAGFTPTQLASFGQSFDQVLFPIDTAAFGSPSDVDANQRFIVLMSPVVNADTPAATCSSQGYVAGFFDTEDFQPASDPHSNVGEIFYTVVPDPAATVSCAHPVSEVDAIVPGVFLHELEHLISFSQHVIVSEGTPASGWADEGLAIVAEELGSVHYEQMCPPPACRTNPAQIFPDSSQGYVQSLLIDSYQYALLPDTASVTLHTDADDGTAWRGGTWLLMRYLGDQKGNAFFRAMGTGPSDGVLDIEHATGQPFPQLFADFGLALYTDSLPGLARATATAVNRFVTRNPKQLWARLYNTSNGTLPTATPLRLFSITSDTSSNIMYPGTTTYFRLDTPAGASAVTIQFSAPGGAAFPSTLRPQLAIFRLPAGQ